MLERAGLISRGRGRNTAPAAGPQALKAVDKWLEAYRQLWEARLDRLQAYLARSQNPKPQKPKRKRG